MLNPAKFNSMKWTPRSIRRTKKKKDTEMDNLKVGMDTIKMGMDTLKIEDIHSDTKERDTSK